MPRERIMHLKIDASFHNWMKSSAAQRGLTIKEFGKEIARKNSNGGMNFEFKI
jgi:hypothetical protein